MRVCLAQTKPVAGNIEANIEAHLRFVELAINAHAELIVFPELSITGYEPALAKGLATTPDDARFDAFQKCSDKNNISIGIGAPLKNGKGIVISLFLFHPQKAPTVYSKEYIHPDEEPFFIHGQNGAALFNEKEKVALAICYELSVPAHAENASRSGAKFYLASVAKTADGVSKAATRLSEIAKQHSMTALMVNCLGLNDGVLCSGQSAVWNSNGDLLCQLDNRREGILLFDTETKEVRERHCP